ncbi:surface lipoprotein assembly modifier [Neisseria sp. CCUG12390]|uniref:surface lipoprotein assembly modifier n=1 Tax=Neisseria sp. CCUG12390 TaxID=3392035 RepID=UPI003A0FE446
MKKEEIKNIRLFLSVLTFTAAATSAAAPIATPVEVQPDLTRGQVQRSQEPEKSPLPQSEKPAPSMTAEEALQHPALLANALDTALAQQNTDGIRFLLPIYRRLPAEQQNPVLAKYAETVLMQADGNLKQAEKQYREMLAENPEFAPIRLQLAHTLSQNGKQREAAREIAVIRQTPELPPQVDGYLNNFDKYLKDARSWKFDGSLSYLQESNVARAPEQRTYGNWEFEEPKSAHGLAYEVSAQKTVPLKNHWAARVQASVGGKFYWDAHDYDDLIARAETGAVWRDAKQEASFAPFYEKRWYGTEPYSDQVGGTLRYSRILSPKFQLHGAWQSGYKKHDDRKYLDGAAHSLSGTLVHLTTPKQILFYGIDGGIDNARDLSEAYRRYGVRAGWQQNWGNSGNTETALHLLAQRRHYRASDLFGIQRRDTEYAARASLSHKKLSWKGLTPRLNWAWSHIDSNHFYYRYDQHRVFVDIVKRF